MRPFVHTSLPVRVIFGEGTRASLGVEIERLGCRRALVLTTPGQRAAAEAQAISDSLGSLAAGVFAGAVMHTPVDVTERALGVLRECGADCVVALGGGSTIGLGKALALRTGVAQIAVPTTYAGSEMTPVLGQTENGVKTTQRTLDVLPETVIYDVELTLALPPRVSGVSGMNAIAHAVEALYARDGTPLTSLMAEESIRALAGALPRIASAPADRAARTAALYGAWLAGACLGAVGMALHHKLCHVLGGSFDLPHAETHTVILPHAVAYNAAAAPDAMARVARAIGGSGGGENAAQGLYDLSGRLGAVRSLSDLGMPEAAIDRAADLAVKDPYWNPAPIRRDAVRALIVRAWAGDPPRAVGPGDEPAAVPT
ncbi:MAG TPA: maleylacetate reductase [Stellaceae bacterium]|jgi:alcohol dehydrogenase class IV